MESSPLAFKVHDPTGPKHHHYTLEVTLAQISLCKLTNLIILGRRREDELSGRCSAVAAPRLTLRQVQDHAKAQQLDSKRHAVQDLEAMQHPAMQLPQRGDHAIARSLEVQQF